MRLAIFVIFQFQILISAIGQTNYCDDSLRKEDLIGRKVKIFSFNPISSYESSILFDSTTISTLYNDLSNLSFNDFDGKNAEIIAIPKVTNNNFYHHKIYILKINNLLIPLLCSNITDTNFFSANQFHKKYDSIYKPLNKKCFITLDIDYDWISYKFQDFICSLKEKGTDTIIAVNQWGMGVIYTNITAFVIWKKNNQWYTKGFSLAHHGYGYFEARNLQPIYETDIIKYNGGDLLHYFSIDYLNTNKKEKKYDNLGSDYKLVEIWLNLNNVTKRAGCLSGNYLIKKHEEEPDNEFYKLLDYIIRLYYNSTY